MEKCQRCGNPWVLDMSKHICRESNEYTVNFNENYMDMVYLIQEVYRWACDMDNDHVLDLMIDAGLVDAELGVLDL